MKAPISGQVTGREELMNVTAVAESQHYGGGIWTDRFERGFAQFMGARHAILCNSGSSALLLAMSAIELPKGAKVIGGPVANAVARPAGSSVRSIAEVTSAPRF